MSAAVLREAAALMRSRAEAVPVGPWEKEFSDVVRTDVPFGADECWIAETETVERAEHIASWHPAVALAVADWLERVASDAEADNYEPDEFESASTVARTYLGDQS